MAMNTVGFRLDERSLKVLDDIRERLARENPGLEPNRSDALRYAIQASMGVAVPAGTKLPDPSKPRQST